MNPPVLIVSAAIRGEYDSAGKLQLGPITIGGHRPYGVLKVEPLTYGFMLWHDQLDALGDAMASADETLGSLAITAHASWGMDHVNVVLRRAGAPVRLAEMCVPSANVWVHLTGYPIESAA